MTNYIMRFDTPTPELAWEYPFTADSDKVALDYAARHALWRKHNLMVFNNDDHSYLGKIEVKITARIIARMKP